jgi:hypothetical protein
MDSGRTQEQDDMKDKIDAECKDGGDEETIDHVIQCRNRKRSSAVSGSFHRMEGALNKAG